MWIRKYARVRYEMGAIWLKVFKSNFIFLDSPVLYTSFISYSDPNEWWINFKFQCKYCIKIPWISLCWLLLCCKVVNTRLLPETIQLHCTHCCQFCTLLAECNKKSFIAESILFRCIFSLSLWQIPWEESTHPRQKFKECPSLAGISIILS